jgi:3-oxoacyl-[acyl-carrier protein] reductase
MFDLNGKTALITGASGGIGASIAKTLAAAGCRVALHGNRREALDELAASIGPLAVVVTGNLGEAGMPERVVADAEAALGQTVDILVNNAGITRDQLAMRMKDDDWDMVLNVNLTAAFKLSKAVMKGMMKRRWGRIVNITSIVGVTGNGGQANYAASKAGMIGMSKSLAAELASREITVNCVAPGYIATAMTEAITEEQKAKMFQAIPAGRMGAPEDIAAAVLYLASAEASYVTGTTLHVNGGMAMI